MGRIVIYIIIAIILFIVLLNIFWPLIWIAFLCYIGYSIYYSFVLSKRNNNHQKDQKVNRRQNRTIEDDIIDVEYTEVVEEENVKEAR